MTTNSTSAALRNPTLRKLWIAAVIFGTCVAASDFYNSTANRADLAGAATDPSVIDARTFNDQSNSVGVLGQSPQISITGTTFTPDQVAAAYDATPDKVQRVTNPNTGVTTYNITNSEGVTHSHKIEDVDNKTAAHTNSLK